MKLIVASIALVAMAAVGCRTSGSDNNSSAKDFGNPDPSTPQQVTAFVPQGGSTTALIGFAIPIHAQALEIHTNCNLQLAQVYVASEVGVGPLANSGDDQTWMTSSGLARTFTAIQLVVNNFGAPAFCNYTVKAASLAIAE